jgi:hypothetical protein
MYIRRSAMYSYAEKGSLDIHMPLSFAICRKEPQTVVKGTVWSYAKVIGSTGDVYVRVEGQVRWMFDIWVGGEGRWEVYIRLLFGGASSVRKEEQQTKTFPFTNHIEGSTLIQFVFAFLCLAGRLALRDETRRHHAGETGR